MIETGLPQTFDFKIPWLFLEFSLTLHEFSLTTKQVKMQKNMGEFNQHANKPGGTRDTASVILEFWHIGK